MTIMEKIGNSIKNLNKQDVLLAYSLKTQEDVLLDYKTSLNGLNEEEVEKRRQKYGENEVYAEKPVTWYVQLLRSFFNPFIFVLIALVALTLVTDVLLNAPGNRDYKTVIIITTMILISGVVQFIQEYRSGKAASALKNMVKTTCAVKRDGDEVREIPMSEVVPGDIIYLAAGDMIPADLRVLSCKDLFVGQSSLTGESEPVEKFASGNEDFEKQGIPDLENIVLLGTNVISGSAQCIALTTGDETFFGTMASSLAGVKSKSSFEKGIDSVSKLLIRFMLVMVPVVFLINGLTKGDWIEALLFSVSIAVGLTPEMLPVIVTSNLAKGAIEMSKKKTIVKKLDAIQNFGAMDILCTDKTGTLTMDKITIRKHLNVLGQPDLRVLKHAYLNSYFQTGLRNLMDVAILEDGPELGLQAPEENYEKIDEIPFDFVRRRMSVVLKDKEGKRQLITKGAVEEMLTISTYADLEGVAVLMTEDIRVNILKTVEEMNKDGMRVIAIAQKNDIHDDDSFFKEHEDDMVLMGYIGFLDPPKSSAKGALKALREHGVEVKILTGDNDAITVKVCKEVGLVIRNLLLGTDIEGMSDEKLAKAAENTNVFAKLSPLQKERVIRVLQEKGHTVGYMGDGINDAPALKQADVGISVDTAVDIAKEYADVILLEKSLMVLEEGVREGRKVFGNIIKYIKMTVSSNFGNVFSVLIASIFLPFLPMLPIHLILQNLLYSFSQLSIPWDNVDEEYLMAPRKWSAEDIRSFMVTIGPVSSIFDITTFVMLWFVFGANSVGMQSLFHTGWFVEGLLSQTIIVHMIRTGKIPFLESRASNIVIVMTTVVVTLGIIIPQTPFGETLGLVRLPGNYYGYLIVMIAVYAYLSQKIKSYYIKRYGQWF